MTIRIVHINSCVTSKLPIIKKQFLLYIINKHQCNLFTMCILINSLFTVAGNNNTMYSIIRIGNRN